MDDRAITICFSVARHDCILDALRSLHKNTPRELFKVVVLNQSQPNKEFENTLYDLCDIVIRPHLNYGYGQGSNMMARIAPTPFVTIANDDIYFLKGWYEGIMETFIKHPKAMVVAPRSTKDPGWGWGEPGFRYLISPGDDVEFKEVLDAYNSAKQELVPVEKQWKAVKDSPGLDAKERQRLHDAVIAGHKKLKSLQPMADAATLKASQNPENVRKLVASENGSMIDGIAMWNVTFKRKEWAEIGMYDEKFFPGGGEDYCASWRIYNVKQRALSSSLSWNFHYWGATKDEPGGLSMALPPARPNWNRLSTKGFGPDGLYDPDVCCWSTFGTRTDPIVYQAPL